MELEKLDIPMQNNEKKKNRLRHHSDCLDFCIRCQEV
jgi:hypothetical protein